MLSRAWWRRVFIVGYLAALVGLVVFDSIWARVIYALIAVWFYGCRLALEHQVWLEQGFTQGHRFAMDNLGISHDVVSETIHNTRNVRVTIMELF